ncbi:polyphenol oxidase family protein [Timonella sp. A28]|uniref:polyphenol oxidase family protein n=1 Tax=Timonella sp. A28 TaxID=3442640 RepID=UPI003EBF6E8D
MTDGFEIPVTEVDLGPGILAFFTSRVGGYSAPPFNGLNVGDKVHDDVVSVQQNRELLAQIAGGPVRFSRQVHDCEVLDDATYAEHERENPRMLATQTVEFSADGVVTVAQDTPVGVYVADCVPVLLADAEAGVIAAAHAGRPGLEAQVISATLTRMCASGAHMGRIKAAVGPCICAHCYEVPEVMARNFAAVTGTEISQTRWNTVGISLRAAAENELFAAGVTKVEHIVRCTYEDDGYFSHRRATHEVNITEGKSGRFAGVITRSTPSP